MRSVMAMVVAVVLSGCAAVRVATLTDARPSDLVVAATVYAPEKVAGFESAEKWARAWRPARYVVEADMSLRAEVGPAVGVEFPGRVRQLTAAEMDLLWRQVRASGLLDPGCPARMEEGTPIGEVSWPTAVIYVSFSGYRTVVKVAMDKKSRDAVEGEAVVKRLAEWGGR